MTEAPNKSIRWVPLEANPELYTSWCKAMGVDVERFAFYDVYGTEPELLDMVPSPVEAVLLLFPVSNEYEIWRKREDEQEPSSLELKGPQDGIVWFKQTIGNACGTMGLLHALINSKVRHAIIPSSPLDKLLSAAEPLTPLERADLLINSKELAEVHSVAAQGGQSDVPTADAQVDLHFAAYVRTERDGKGKLVELDGRRNRPVFRDVEVPSQSDLLNVSVQYIKDNLMSLNPDEVNFNIIALGPASPH